MVSASNSLCNTRFLDFIIRTILASTICLRSSSICVFIASSSVSVWVVSCVRSRSGIFIRRSFDVKAVLKVMTSEGSRDYT